MISKTESSASICAHNVNDQTYYPKFCKMMACNSFYPYSTSLPESLKGLTYTKGEFCCRKSDIVTHCCFYVTPEGEVYNRAALSAEDRFKAICFILLIKKKKLSNNE